MVEATVVLGLEVFFEDDPGFEASVVGAGEEPGGIAFEAVVANEDVFDGDGKTVTDVEVAVSVGRWEDDGIGVTLLCWLEGC